MRFSSAWLALLGLTALSAPAQAAQEQWPRWYLGLNANVNYLTDADLSGPGGSGDASFDTGFGGTVSLGYMPAFGGWANNFRMEAEAGYNYNEVDKSTIAGVSASNGSIHTWTGMGNLFYDFRNSSRLIPYVGGGAGLAKVHLGSASNFGAVKDDDTVFAYQLMAGVAYTFESLPSTEWSLGYRYRSLGDAEFATAGGGKFNVEDLDSHMVEIGTRLRF